MKIARPKNKQFTFNTLYDNIAKMKSVESGREKYPQFRLSASPFCPYAFIFNWYLFLEEGNTWDYQADFFTGIGTAIHEAIQTWLPRQNPGFILGNWRCRKCCKHPSEKECTKCTKDCKFYSKTSVGAKICTKCDGFMSYEEFHFIIPPLTSGHCDGVMLHGNKIYEIIQDMNITPETTYKVDNFLRKVKKPIDAYVLEYKSTTKSNSFKLTSPKLGHTAQACMYTIPAQHLLDKAGLNINVKGSLVKYIARDLPFLTSKDFIIEKDESFYKQNVLATRLLLKAIKDGNLSCLSTHLKKLPCKGKHKELHSECKFMKECEQLRKNGDIMFDATKKEIKKTFIQFRNKFSTQLKELKK